MHYSVVAFFEWLLGVRSWTKKLISKIGIKSWRVYQRMIIIKITTAIIIIGMITDNIKYFAESSLRIQFI